MFNRISDLAKRDIPFLFIIDFDQQKPIVRPLEEAADAGIWFDIKGMKNYESPGKGARPIHLGKHPIPYEAYLNAFNTVQRGLKAGNSFLTNLTFATPIDLNLSLQEVFLQSEAKYKLWLDGQFVVFSPESFVQIRENKISSYPMKGTIDAKLPNAAQQILHNPKEKAEHYTIVDLIRNDLSRVASQVRVESFRFLDYIHTSGKDLLQVSSKISGVLPKDYRNHLGEILHQLLPAGSITGAPKVKTVEIIRQAETYERGYYSGIFGYYANGQVESAVMIRFIEQTESGYLFKSGGGITVYSNPESEYQELIDKIYVPINRNYSDQKRQDSLTRISSKSI